MKQSEHEEALLRIYLINTNIKNLYCDYQDEDFYPMLEQLISEGLGYCK